MYILLVSTKGLDVAKLRCTHSLISRSILVKGDGCESTYILSTTIVQVWANQIHYQIM